MSDDRRDAARRDAFRVGSLRVEGRPDPVECLVWDISRIGAQVEVEGGGMVPDRFTLLIGAYARPRACAVVRRDGRRLGVRFGA